MPQPCPRCGEPLSTRAFGATTIDGCPACGGLWFDYQELNRVTHDPSVGLMEIERAFQRAMFSDGSGGEMQCPSCAQPLREFSFPHTPNVKLDACPSCKGIWVDDGEMAAIAERVACAQSSPAESATAAETQRLQSRTVTGFLLSAPCPKCDTTNPAGSLSCWACGASLKTHAAYRLCPRCDQSLEERWCGSNCETRVDVCLKCTGVWLEAGEVSAFYQLGLEVVNDIQAGVLLHRADPAPFWNEVSRARCPGCHYEMENETYGSRRPVRVDRCNYCKSLWLDAGELLAVYDMMQTGDFVVAGASESDPWADAQ